MLKIKKYNKKIKIPEMNLKGNVVETNQTRKKNYAKILIEPCFIDYEIETGKIIYLGDSVDIKSKIVLDKIKFKSGE